MKSRIKQAINHQISSGSADFQSVKSQSKCVGIQINYVGLDREDATVSVQQSNDDKQFNVISNASKALQSALPSHTFTVVDVCADEMRVTLDIGTATTGSITDIFWLFE
jgi:hypothetical protein